MQREALFDGVADWLECLEGLEQGRYERVDGGVFPTGFMETGELSAIHAHEAIFTNHVYPWTRELTAVSARTC